MWKTCQPNNFVTKQAFIQMMTKNKIWAVSELHFYECDFVRYGRKSLQKARKCCLVLRIFLSVHCMLYCHAACSLMCVKSCNPFLSCWTKNIAIHYTLEFKSACCFACHWCFSPVFRGTKLLWCGLICTYFGIIS